jgi:AcrR family transcriptional regulator
MATTKGSGREPAATTPERILDAAEDLFALKGYKGTSLGDVAERVGIRSPSLYNHFRNKEALYRAVLTRLLDDFAAPMEELTQGPISDQRLQDWLETIVRKHHANPNLARLLQHAALSGGPGTTDLIERFFQPMFGTDEDLAQPGLRALGEAGLQPWAVMAFNNLVMSYVTMAPMYRDLLGQDPFGEEALERQLALVKILLRAVLALPVGLAPLASSTLAEAPLRTRSPT